MVVVRVYSLSLLVSGLLAACDDPDVTVEGSQGPITVIINECTAEATDPLANDAGGSEDDPRVIATCDDHKPCTVDVQCTPCSMVPEEIRYVKATCTADNQLSPFCFSPTGALLYVGCTHFAQEETPVGVINACAPVEFPLPDDGEVHTGVCNAYGVCVENPP